MSTKQLKIKEIDKKIQSTVSYLPKIEIEVDLPNMLIQEDN